MAINIFRIILILSGFYHIKALHLTHISVPQIADFRDIVTLSCSYNMGTHTLNSVKWYKNDMEFFRYSPMTIPNIMKFDVNGVSLAEKTFNCDKITCSVKLERLGPRTNGAYRCEISGDAPEFKLVSKTANMTIAALPRHDPDINGLAQSYEYGDFVQANCTSDKSSPPANLMWYINDEKVSPEFLQPQQETTIQANEYKLRYRSLEIRFHIDKARFGKLKYFTLTCIAQIDLFPILKREKVVEVYIVSADDLTNQKLVNWRNSGASINLVGYRNIILLLGVLQKNFKLK